MLTIEDIVEKLKDRNVMEISRRTGIHYNLIYKLKNGITKRPSYSLIKKLSDYLQDK